MCESIPSISPKMPKPLGEDGKIFNIYLLWPIMKNNACFYRNVSAVRLILGDISHCFWPKKQPKAPYIGDLNVRRYAASNICVI